MRDLPKAFHSIDNTNLIDCQFSKLKIMLSYVLRITLGKVNVDQSLYI